MPNRKLTCLPAISLLLVCNFGVAMLGAGEAHARAAFAQPASSGGADEEAQRRREALLERRRQAQEQFEEQAEQRRQRLAELEGAEDISGLDDEGGEANTITLAAFSEPIELENLIELVAMTLGIEISVKGAVTGSVVFNSPQEMPESRLLGFLEALLEQHGYAIYRDPEGFYVVTPASELGVASFGEFGTTRIISTPNVKPTGLQTALDAQFGGGQGRLGAQQGGGIRLSYVDDLSVIVATGSPRKIRQVEEMVDELLNRYSAQQFFVIELEHVAAPAARQRLVDLFGSTTGGVRAAVQRNAENVSLGGGDSLDNLAERLTADPASNALIFRGLAEEAAEVESLMRLIDRPTSLVPRRYFAGSAAAEIADIASQRGLGEVITLQDGTQSGNERGVNLRQINNQQNQLLGNQTAPISGGSAMVVDVRGGTIIYYGTRAQQTQLATLIQELDTEAEVVVIREYRLQHADAEQTAELLNNLVSSARPTGESSLIPGASSAAAGVDAQRFVDAQALGDDLALSDSENIFVIADTANNQLLVKAPKKQQNEFERLINKIDRRRAQVYIEATIVSVSKNEDFRLAIEQQFINAGGSGGVIQTNFGLTADQSDDITLPRVVNPSLSGLTSALILTDYIPVVINAIQTDTDARIISKPQILVDDNEEAELVSLEQQPTTTQTTGQTTDQTTFGGFEDAGTRLLVTPSISEGGYMRLSYEIELSNFVGQGSGGIPPPRQERTVRGDSVTIPDDTTIVVGGLTVQEVRDTVVKVPLLGDIPLLGQAFRDTRKFSNDAVLYIFITPKIMRDPNFADLRLLSRGPQSVAKLDPNVPELQPSTIEILPGGMMSQPVGFDSSTPTTPAPAQPASPEPTPRQPARQQPANQTPAAGDPNAGNPWIRPAPATAWPTDVPPDELRPARQPVPGDGSNSTQGNSSR